MKTLYALTDEALTLLRLAEDAADPAEMQAFSDQLETLSGEIDAKVLGCAAIVRQLVAEAEAVKTEKDRLASRQKSLEAAADRLKAYMKGNMEAVGLERIKGELFTVSIQKNPDRCVLHVEPHKLPKKFQRVTVAADLGGLKEAIKGGEDLSAFCHTEFSSSIRIR